MSSAGQVVGGVLGAVGGFLFGGGPIGAVRGALLGATLGGYIDPPPGPNLMGPTLEDKGFNSAAYGVSLATLYGTIATTGSIFYLENNEYKSVAKKQKTGGKGGGAQGSYTTTTYYATFAVAIGEAMPGSVIRRIWAGAKLIYSVGDGVDVETLLQSNKNAEGWRYYDGTQTEPDSRMEAVLGIDNCPSYEGSAYLMFYDFNLTDYGNGLQGCPIKVEVVTLASESETSRLPEKIFESVAPYPKRIYDPHRDEWQANNGFVRSLTLSSAEYIASWYPSDYDWVKAVYHTYTVPDDRWQSATSDEYYSAINNYAGLTFGRELNWQQYDPSLGSLANYFPTRCIPVGFATVGSRKITYGSNLISESLDWHEEDSKAVACDGECFYIINADHIVKLSGSGVVAIRRNVDDWEGTGVHLWYDDGFLYRAAPRGSSHGWNAKIWIYDASTLTTLRSFEFGYFPNFGDLHGWQFAVYGGVIVVGWSTRYDAPDGRLHYEQWRFKDFVATEPVPLDTVVGRIMTSAGVTSDLRDLSALTSDDVSGYRITDASSARGKLGPLQVAYLFDLIDSGYKIKAVKRGGEPVLTIPLSDLGARAAGESLGVLVRREIDTASQLPSRYSLTYLDYNREYDTNTQYSDYPSNASNERNQQLPIVLTAQGAAQLADVLINLAWIERYQYSISVTQKYLDLKLADVIRVEVAVGKYSILRVTSVNFTADQRLEISAKQAEPAVYQSSAVGVDIAPPGENISLLVDASTVLMNLPAIKDETTSYGFGVAMSGGKNWSGGALLRSIDAGQTYDAIQAFSDNCTIARVANLLSPGDYFVIDRASQLFINIIAGEFFSIIEAQMLMGKNYCAYGLDGRWEIIQYAGATVISGSSVMLDTFVRGLFGTEWAGDLHQANDIIVFLDDPDNAFIGADAVALGSPRKFKGVTNGIDAQLVNEIDFTYSGINLKPLSPVNVSGYSDGSTWYVAFEYRSRFSSSQWTTGTVAQVGEASLKFEIDVYDGAVVKKTYQLTSPSFVYPPASQLADFGFYPSVLKVAVYQISATVGRGFPAYKTIAGVNDPLGDLVSLLMHFGGANNSTVFVDSSKTPKTIAVNGDAKISADHLHFGVSNAKFDGTGDYLSITHHAQLNLSSSSFCIEVFVWFNSVPPLVQVILDKDGVWGTSHPSYQLCIDSNGKLRAVLGNGTATSSNQIYTGATTLTLNTWMHVAFTFDGTTVRVFLNGVLDVSSTTLPTRTDGGKPLLIGYATGHPVNCYLNGYLQDLRITKGNARYTANFTPPASILPDPT